jgi:Flp pilus assembly protein TadG
LAEFSLVVPLFFLLLFGIIDLGRLFFVQITLQHSMRQAARFAVTGNRSEDPNRPGEMLSRVDSIIMEARKAAAGLDISNIQISSSGATQAGGPKEYVTISLTTNLRLITPLIGRFFGPDSTYRFTVQSTFRNEPFPPEQSDW